MKNQKNACWRPSSVASARNFIFLKACFPFKAAWRNGIASDYESGDCRFDPCGGHFFNLLCHASLHKHILFLLVSFICDIPETLFDGWQVRSHLPEVAYTDACMIHCQRYCRLVIGAISLRRGGEISRHSWVARRKVSQKNILGPHSVFV